MPSLNPEAKQTVHVRHRRMAWHCTRATKVHLTGAHRVQQSADVRRSAALLSEAVAQRHDIKRRQSEHWHRRYPELLPRLPKNTRNTYTVFGEPAQRCVLAQPQRDSRYAVQRLQPASNAVDMARIAPQAWTPSLDLAPRTVTTQPQKTVVRGDCNISMRRWRCTHRSKATIRRLAEQRPFTKDLLHKLNTTLATNLERGTLLTQHLRHTFLTRAYLPLSVLVKRLPFQAPHRFLLMRHRHIPQLPQLHPPLLTHQLSARTAVGRMQIYQPQNSKVIGHIIRPPLRKHTALAYQKSVRPDRTPKPDAIKALAFDTLPAQICIETIHAWVPRLPVVKSFPPGAEPKQISDFLLAHVEIAQDQHRLSINSHNTSNACGNFCSSCSNMCRCQILHDFLELLPPTPRPFRMRCQMQSNNRQATPPQAQARNNRWHTSDIWKPRTNPTVPHIQLHEASVRSHGANKIMRALYAWQTSLDGALLQSQNIRLPATHRLADA